MKLLLVTEFFPADLNLKFTGGVETRIYYLVKNLAKRHKIYVICRKNGLFTSLQAPGVCLYPCGLSIFNIEANFFSVFERLIFSVCAFIKGLSLDFDLVEGSNFVSFIPAFCIGFFKKKPVISWWPDVFKGRWIKFFGFTGFFGEIIERVSLKLPWTKVIALSSVTGEKLIKAGIKKEKIKIIYGGVELSKSEVRSPAYAEPACRQGRASAGRQKSEVKNIICISRLVKYKRVQDLIEAFDKLSKEDKDLSLTIIGQGPEEEKLKKLVKDNNLEKKVLFLKNLSRDDLIKNLQQSYLFCLPSIVEGFGLATIEAASLKLPYVISDIPINKEITQDGKGGLLFKQENVSDLINKLNSLLGDEILYQKKQKEAFALAKQYDWQIMSKATEKVYQNCLLINGS